MEVGLYAGSFDPVHLGHMALIDAASGMLDRIVVVVAVNSQKPTGMFPVRERLEMLTLAAHHLGNVQVTAHSGLLIDIAARVGATVLVRSAGKEHAIERQMAYFNSCEGLRTLLIPPDPRTAFISSSQVRGLIAVGALDAATKLVPPGVTDPARGGQQ
jgi:pantetheine-phosphate adenylyltransferase